MARFGWVLVLALLAGSEARPDDKDDPVPEQRKAARENWDKVDAGPVVVEETEHLIVLGGKDHEKRLKELAGQLEKYCETATRALYPAKENAWTGKMAVYLFEQPAQYEAFVRRIEKRRLLGQESGTFSVADDQPHTAACPPRQTSDPPVEVQAGEQLAAAVMQKRAGAKTVLPGWLLTGFGRATHQRVLGATEKSVQAERQRAARYAAMRKRNLQDVWGGGLESDERTVLQTSAADFFAYGPARSKINALLDGFKPGENEERKTIQQAMEAAAMELESMNKTWKVFVATTK